MTTAVVWEGDRDSPTVLVLDSDDPAGPVAGPGELPPGWQPMSRQRQVVWCRLAAPGALAEADRLLADPDALGRPIDTVIDAGATDVVGDLIRRHAGPIRAVVLVHTTATGDRARDTFDDVVVRAVAGAGQRPLADEDVCTDVAAALAALDEEGVGRLPRNERGAGA